MSTRNYTRIPPESTGDRIQVVPNAIIFYDAKISHTWQINEEYTITGNGGNTFKFNLHSVYETNSTTGVLYGRYNDQAIEEGYIASDNQSIQYDTNNDDILETIATVNTNAQDLYTPAYNIVGYDNSSYGLNVDRFGSAQVTFQDGPPEVTSFGNLRSSAPRLLANYDFTHSALRPQFANSREGDGVLLEWQEDDGQVRLYCPDVTNTRVTHTSNLFHAHTIGGGNLFVLGARLGDAGKANVVRLWGAFDATDGYFFQMNGTTLRVVHRYTLEGNPTVNHGVDQSDWNLDTLDGTGGESNPSGMNLDVTKSNIYWIDYQFVAGGRTRYGVYYKGQRIACHEIDSENGSGNISNTNGLRNPNRPMCWAQATQGTNPGSVSEFWALGGSVWSEAESDPLVTAQQYSEQVTRKVWAEPQKQPFWKTYYSNGTTPAIAAANSAFSSQTSTQYLFSISPKQLYTGSTRENHSVYQPLTFYVSSYDVTTGSARPVELRVFAKCIMRGVDWSSGGVSAPTVDVDDSGDHLAHGPEIARFIVDGDKEISFSSSTNAFQYNTVRNLSDQPFSRDFQSIAELDTDADKYTLGYDRVKIKIGAHPLFGSSIHYFDDRQPVVISNGTGGFNFAGIFAGSNTLKTSAPSGYASVDYITSGNETLWYYLSLIDRDEAWLYSSQADIDDDRTIRKLTVSAVGTTALGDTLTMTSGSQNGATGIVAKIVGTTEIWIIARDEGGPGSSSIDVGTTGNFDTTTGGAGVGNVSVVALDTGVTRDYWTSLLALKSSDLGFTVDEILTSPNLALYGNPPPRQAWTFMARNLTNTVPDDDGDAGPALNNVNVRTTVVWRERTQ